MLRFSLSSNGDQWYLTRGSAFDETAVVREANRSSGGAVTKLSLDEFLHSNAGSPERRDFARLIADLLGKELDGGTASKDMLLLQLRDATEEDATSALLGARVALPLTTPYEALEFFNRLVDVVTGRRAIEDREDADRIRPGFGSTHR
jgi:hypothetical protein